MGNEDPEFPDLPLADYLVDWFLDVGPDWLGGMDRTALPHIEIRAWAMNTHLDLFKTEADWLVAMSRAFVSEVARSSNKDVPAPYIAPKETGD